MNLVKFIKGELSGWNKSEKIFIPIFILFVLFSSIILKDKAVATASAIFGLLYTILAGKGKISCFFFGLQGTLCYSYLSWENALYGNLFLYMGYYFPMQILGIFKWKKHLKKETNEIKKTFLSNKDRIILTICSLVVTIIFAMILYKLNDTNPILDAAATILSLTGMYLTVKRCIEQWIIWTIVNFLMIIIWLQIFINGGNTFATLLMWCGYFVLGIYFLCKWHMEIQKDKDTF